MWVREVFLMDPLEYLMIAADLPLEHVQAPARVVFCLQLFLPNTVRGLRPCGTPSVDAKILFGD